MKPLIHFEDGSTRPDVFRITAARVAAARKRNRDAGALVGVSCGMDFDGIDRWIARASGLVCSSATLLNPRFPLRALAAAGPQLSGST